MEDWEGSEEKDLNLLTPFHASILELREPVCVILRREKLLSPFEWRGEPEQGDYKKGGQHPACYHPAACLPRLCLS